MENGCLICPKRDALSGKLKEGKKTTTPNFSKTSSRVIASVRERISHTSSCEGLYLQHRKQDIKAAKKSKE